MAWRGRRELETGREIAGEKKAKQKTVPQRPGWGQRSEQGERRKSKKWESSSTAWRRKGVRGVGGDRQTEKIKCSWKAAAPAASGRNRASGEKERRGKAWMDRDHELSEWREQERERESPKNKTKKRESGSVPWGKNGVSRERAKEWGGEERRGGRRKEGKAAAWGNHGNGHVCCMHQRPPSLRPSDIDR